MQLEFGAFDHLDRGHRSVRDVYDFRLKLCERYEQAGFYAFHPAEHHSTPLSCSPSPNVFMAAAMMRTKRLKFAPLVYILPMYQPLRLLDEICMLDHLSGGRIELGIGRGIAPFELIGWGINPLESLEIYKEVLDILLIGMTSENKTVTYHGHHFRYTDVPIEMEPLQRPHPPLWYGVWKDPQASVWPASVGANICGIIGSKAFRPLVDRFKEEWAKHQGAKPLPKIGVNRTCVVAETRDKALALAKRAQPVYARDLGHLWHRWGAENAHFPHDFEGALAKEMILVGTPAEVREQIEQQAYNSGINYQICRFAYGDLTDEEVNESLTLFIEEVMPHFSGKPAQVKAAE